MNKRILSLIICVMASCFCSNVWSQQNAYVEDQIVLSFHTGHWQQFLNQGSRELSSFEVLEDINHRYRLKSWRVVGLNTFKPSDRDLLYQTSLPVQLVFNGLGQDIHKAMEEYRSTGLFAHVELNYRVWATGILGAEVIPDDPFWGRQWAFENDGTFDLASSVAGADIDMPEGWDITTGSSDVIMAILDTGSKLNHPEYAGRLWVNTEETVNGLDDDDNGFIDDINGYDFVNRDPDPTDDDSHGTAVGGVIVATGDNGIGYAGVDWHCRIMTCKVLNNEGSGDNIPIAEAIFYAANNGADVMNLSLGSQSYNAFVETAVDFATLRGSVIVSAMGNAGIETNHYPAAIDNVIAVGSTDPDDKRSTAFVGNPNFGSNFGSYIDLVAPGNFIYSLSYNSNTNYNRYYGGTSLATPYVAGICALLRAQDPGRTPAEIRTILHESSEDMVGDDEDTPGWDKYFGHGRLNAFQALSYDLAPVHERNIGTIKVYPNPVPAGLLKLLIQDGEGEYLGHGIFTLRDVLGNVIGRLHPEVESGTLGLMLPGSLTQGSYILEWSNGNKRLVQKLIVN